MNGNKENATRIGTVIWTYDGGLPMEHILSHWTWNKNRQKAVK
jgi:hypothetical protein